MTDSSTGMPLRQGGAFSRFLTLLFSPILFVAKPFVFRVGHERGNPKVYLTSFSSLIYLWPLMAIGVIGNWFMRHNWSNPATLGWVWLTVLLVVIVCIGTDMNRNRAFMFTVLVSLFWILGMLLNAKYQIPVLKDIHDYLARQGVRYQPGLAKVVSLAIGIILLFVFIMAWLDGRYEITSIEITHRRVFATADSVPRAATRVMRDWRDIAEVFIGLGAGDVIVIDGNKNLVMRIPNVPFLWFFRHDVDHVLEVLATTRVDESSPMDKTPAA